MYMAIFDYHSDDPHHLNFTAGATLVVSQNAGGWLLGYLESEGASKSPLWFPAAYAALEPEPAPEPVPEPAPAQLRLPPGTRRKRPAVISVALEAAGTSDEVQDGMFALGTSTSFNSVNKNIEREVAHEMETEGLIASGSVVLVGGAENNDWVLDDKGHGPGWQRNKCAQEFGNSTLKYIQCLGDFSRYYRVTLETVIREFDGGHSGETTNYMSQLFADYKALEGAHKKLYATVATFWHTCKGEANINAQWIGIQPLINIFVDDERIAFLQVRRAPACLLAGCTGWPWGNARHSRLALGAGGARPGGGQLFQIPEGLGRAARQQRQGAGYRGVVAGGPSNGRCLGARR
jgi:hypothetical protein